jgi:peptidoglycan hydrolase-like protein with peptidoglycan-binding domain
MGFPRAAGNHPWRSFGGKTIPMRIRFSTRLAAVLLTATFAFVAASGATAPQRKSSSSASSTIKKKKRPGRRKKRDRGQKAPTAERIKEIQQALGKDGLYAGAPTGMWDGPTVEGLRNFQAANGLRATGKLDARSLQKLGLGSGIAGVAAPIPSAAASSTDPITIRRQQ